MEEIQESDWRFNDLINEVESEELNDDINEIRDKHWDEFNVWKDKTFDLLKIFYLTLLKLSLKIQSEKKHIWSFLNQFKYLIINHLKYLFTKKTPNFDTLK